MQSDKEYGIILRHDCTRYARMREVAALEAGNFRGVCPILEPGERITDSDGIRSLGREVTPLRNGRNQCSDLIC